MKNSTNSREFPTNLLFWALLFISVALLLLLDAVGIADALLPAGLSIWKVLLGALIAWGLILGIIKRQPFMICFAVTGEVILFDQYVLAALGSDKQRIAPALSLLLIALLLSIGFLLLKIVIKTSRPPVHAPQGNRPHAPRRNTGKAAGTSTQYFDCSAPFRNSIENDLGVTLVFFTNTEHYVGESTLHIDNNVGTVILHAPADFQIVPRMGNSLGSIILPPSPSANPQKRLVLQGENNMGCVTVKYQPVAGATARSTTPPPTEESTPTPAPEAAPEAEILPPEDENFTIELTKNE